MSRAGGISDDIDVGVDADVNIGDGRDDGDASVFGAVSLNPFISTFTESKRKGKER